MKIKNTTILQRLSIVLGMIGIILLISGTLRVRGIGVSHAQAPEKITICHAAGLAGTQHFETLTISYSAVYGPGGHFNENGTPQAGHERDYLGPCISALPTQTLTPTSTATTVIIIVTPEETPEVTPTDELDIPDDGGDNELVPATGIDLAAAAAVEKAITTGNILIRFGLVAIGIALVAFGLSRRR